MEALVAGTRGRPMRAAGMAALGLLLLGAATPAQADRPLVVQAEGKPGDELDRLREDLFQPGPEARQRREVAIERLLGNERPEAHLVLQQALRRGDDADQVSRTILRDLARKFANPQDPVFGVVGRNADQLKSRGAIVRSYLPILAKWLGEAAAPREGAPREAFAQVRACLLAMPLRERLEGFQQLLADGDAEVRRSAVHAAAECRDPGLARLVAEFLEDPLLGSDARRAIERITFARDLRTKKDFEAWADAQQGRTYVDLAEDAARGALDTLDEVRRSADERLAAAVGVLLETLVAREPVDWKLVRQWLLNGNPPAVLRAGARRLHAALDREPRFSGVAADRLALLDEVLRRIEGDPGGDLHPLFLELAALLVAPGEAEPREKVQQRLRAGLESKVVPVQRAAIAGLARFPSPQHRTLVVRAARAAMAERRLEVVGAALATLAARDFPAPEPNDPDLEPWCELLRMAVREAGIEARQRSLALQVLVQRDVHGQVAPRAVDLLFELAADAQIESVVREQALVRLSALSAERGPGERYAQLLAGLLADNDARLRLQAAQLLAKLGEDGWSVRLAERVRERLLGEADEPTLKALVEAIKRRAGQTGGAEPSLQMLTQALQALHLEGRNQGASARRALLADALTTLAATQGTPPTLWVQAGEVLVLLQGRENLRYLLARQKPAGLPAGDQEQDELAQRALQLVPAAALLKPRDVPWSAHAEEAEEVLAALAALEKGGAGADRIEWRMLRLEILSGLERATQALELAQSLLRAGERSLTPEQRVTAQWVVAQANTRIGELDAALAALQALPREVQVEPRSQALQEELARALLTKTRNEEAARLAEQVLLATDARSPRWAERFLLSIEARFAAEPARRAELLRRLDARAEQLTRVPEDLRRRLDECRKRLNGSQG